VSFPYKDARRVVREALREDVGDGDITTEAVVGRSETSRARLVSRSEGIVCGLPIWEFIFGQAVRVKLLRKDGDVVVPDSVVAILEGSSRRILTRERVALNLLCHLSGVTTTTGVCVSAARGKLRVLDTRKTTPLLRSLEKYAVRVGGGENHRFGLDRMILIKENHAPSAGGLAEAAKRALAWRRRTRRHVEIEVEVRTEVQLRAVAELGVDRIMLDHWNVGRTRRAVALARKLGFGGRIEGSGDMTPKRIRALSDSGLDDVSVGSITHSARPLDFTLLFEGATT
jgi:nicotinate-nucleotide pyrophosphorylase (carboxylating)